MHQGGGKGKGKIKGAIWTGKPGTKKRGMK